MYWSTDKSILKHGEEYLVTYNDNSKIYNLKCYFNKEDEDILFTGEGFYSFLSNRNTWLKTTQPDYWMKIYPPTNI